MIEHSDSILQAFKKAFNLGYKLQKSKPELASKLSNGFEDKEHPFAKGFEKGAVTENFGSQLVKSFSRQLDATVEVISNLGQGTSTLIKINRFERV